MGEAHLQPKVFIYSTPQALKAFIIQAQLHFLIQQLELSEVLIEIPTAHHLIQMVLAQNARIFIGKTLKIFASKSIHFVPVTIK